VEDSAEDSAEVSAMEVSLKLSTRCSITSTSSIAQTKSGRAISSKLTQANQASIDLKSSGRIGQLVSSETSF